MLDEAIFPEIFSDSTDVVVIVVVVVVFVVVVIIILTVVDVMLVRQETMEMNFVI